jgi:hypothetical protein
MPHPGRPFEMPAGPYRAATDGTRVLARRQRGRLAASLVVLFVTCVSTLPAGAQYDGGSGTAGDPYLIRTPEQMNAIGANPGHWNKHFKLMADIDLSAYTGTAFHIIGTGSPVDVVTNPFTGVFDGNGRSISNFTYTSTGVNAIAIFGNVGGVSAEIKDLRLINPNVNAGSGDYVGALAGTFAHGKIIGCSVEGGNVSGRFDVGVLVGLNEGMILECCSSGGVWGDWYVGGLAGDVGDGKVTECYSVASVSGNRHVGGLVGKTSDENSVIMNSYATGPVIGGLYVGGLVGEVERGAASKCFSAGSVSGNQYVGGLVGNVRALGRVMHSFWDTQASSQPTSAAGIGKTTDQMQTMSTFAASGWDFFNVWTICEGTNYPVLLWQIPAGDFRCPDGVDRIDLAWFCQRWLHRNCFTSNNFCEGVDLDQSSFVDFADFAIFADNWLTGAR